MSAMVICSTWDLGSGTLPTRMSRAVSMRRLVSVSSKWSPSGGELVQGNVVLHVFGDESAILRRHCLEVRRGKHGVGGQVGELPGVDNVADAAAGDVGLEVSLDGRDGGRLFGLAVGDELGEL